MSTDALTGIPTEWKITLMIIDAKILKNLANQIEHCIIMN
jgi:hypothetical protein